MILAGIDCSINSPAYFTAEFDENFDIVRETYDWYAFTTVQKTAVCDWDQIAYFKKKQFSSGIEQMVWMRDKIVDRLLDEHHDYIAMEDYAFAGTGRVFQIGEMAQTIKLPIYEAGIPLRLYTPSQIKKLATGYGNADKIRMEQSYVADGVHYFDHLPEHKNPKEDLIDAYYITMLLALELKIRHGIVQVQDLPLKQIEIFNQVSKANPLNILVRDFIQKPGE